MIQRGRLKILFGFINLIILLYIIYAVSKPDLKIHYRKVISQLAHQTNLLHRTPQYHLKSNVSSPNKLKCEQVNQTKTLLLWTPQNWFNDWVGNKWDTSRVFDKCRVSNCVLTKQRQYMDNADIVLFRARDLKNCLKKTKREQIWMIFEHEAPTSFEILSKLDQHCYRNAFNWTLTYRRDSDFTFVHGLFSKRTSIFNESVVDKIIKSKTKTAVAFISHCHSPSRRLEYIQRLRQNGIDVDIYGECGTLKCKYGLGYAGDFKMIWKVASDLKMKKDCFDVLDSRYKFYISFENSLCDDYNTEKSHHLVLQHNIIPIIRDASNHSLFHPPKSYLDTKDFKTVKSLADRIKQINYSSDEYKKYLQWKKYFYSETVRGVLQSNMCDICERLHNQDKYRRIHGNIVDFLFTRGDKSPICHKPLDL